MSAILRNVTRTILNTTETTLKTDSTSADSLAFVITTSDALYVGADKPFSSRYFHFSTVNTNSISLTVKYWNGTSYVAVEDPIDQTLGFTRNGFISWQNPTTDAWESVVQSGVPVQELYWIKIEVTGATSAGTALQSITNLFCDQVLLRSYYPEIVANSRYLPPGRSDFMDQLVAAKNLVVLRLKQDGIIDDESEILDINEVAVSATHATAWIILSPIAVDEGDKERAKDAFDSFNRELNKVKLDFDYDNSGQISDTEKDTGNYFLVRG
jgi:hypothetical protein